MLPAPCSHPGRAFRTLCWRETRCAMYLYQQNTAVPHWCRSLGDMPFSGQLERTSTTRLAIVRRATLVTKNEHSNLIAGVAVNHGVWKIRQGDGLATLRAWCPDSGKCLKELHDALELVHEATSQPGAHLPLVEAGGFEQILGGEPVIDRITSTRHAHAEELRRTVRVARDPAALGPPAHSQSRPKRCRGQHRHPGSRPHGRVT